MDPNTSARFIRHLQSLVDGTGSRGFRNLPPLDPPRLPPQSLSLPSERKDTLALMPVADLATGETVGDTCLFQARAGWLKTAGHFKGVFQDLKIQDQTFKAVPFDFPEGNDKD